MVVVGSRWLNGRIADRWCWLVVLLCLQAGVAGAQDPKSPTTEPAVQASAQGEDRLLITTGLAVEALAQQYPEAAVWLENSDGGKELALLEVEQRLPLKGAVLILAGEGQSAGSGLAAAMREPLAARGWAAMTLGLPQVPLVVLGPAGVTDTGSPKVEDAAAAPVAAGESPSDRSVIDVVDSPAPAVREQQYRDRVQSTLSAAVTELRGRGYQRIALVGIGGAAAAVMREALEAPGQPRELVWIEPYFSAEERTAWPATLGDVGGWRLLDLTNALSDPRTASRRAAVFRRQGIDGYQQQSLALSQPMNQRDAAQVVNRISAWLERKGR